MKATVCSKWLAALLPLALMGCGGGASSGGPKTPATTGPKAEVKPAAPAKDDKAEAEEGLAKLSPEDRKLAEAQGYCAVNTDDRLGSMGKPIKLEVKGEPVFLCCGGCKKEALADPDKTLAKVKELKAKVRGAAGK
jgi:hypothetical protein